MKLEFPSREFDEAVASVCHGTGSDEQMRALNELLRGDAAARDEYILRVELHSRLASEPDLFVSTALETSAASLPGRGITPLIGGPVPEASRMGRKPRLGGVIALAACAALLAAGWWGWRLSRPTRPPGTTSKAVAMLNRVVDVRWEDGAPPPRLGSPQEPGWLRLKSGLVQIVFYSGARMVLEGPAEVRLVSPSEAACRTGRMLFEVPPEAHGFRIGTPQMQVTDLGTVFGVDVKAGQTELHVFKGRVEFQKPDGSSPQNLLAGGAARAVEGGPARTFNADPEGFASLFDLQRKSVAAEALRYDRWRETSRELHADRSLLAHFDFEHSTRTDWLLRNTGGRTDLVSEATIVGCQWVEGRWPAKTALEFHGVSDRVRLSVPGEYDSLTVAAWVRVQGLDRQFNSLFMSDGFEAGTIHWLIRKDGVLGLTVIGRKPGDYQIVASPPVLSLDEFGLWLHLAVVLDGSGQRVAHYVNGRVVSEKQLRISPPFRVGLAELGNWNASGFPGNDPSLIRNFSGAMDELSLFARALSDREIQKLYLNGKPQPEPIATR